MSYSYNTAGKSSSDTVHIDASKSTAQYGESIQTFSWKVIDRLESILAWFNQLATSGTVASATNATTASKLSTNAGSSTQPIYFSSGTPTACGTSLAVDITGNAATATNATTAASCTGNAATATTATTATTCTTVADSSTNGVMKLYTSTGNSTDGTMTRQAITTALSGKLDTNGKAALSAKLEGIYTSSGGQQPPSYFGTNAVGCLMSDKAINGDSSYKNWIYADSYHGSDAGGATAIGVSRDTARAFIMQSDANRNTWNNTAELAAIAAQGTDYIKFSNGFKICWGLKSDSSASGSISYPGGGFSYSSYVASSTCSNYGHEKWIRITAAYTTYFNYGGTDGYNGSFYWIAVGF